MTNITRPQTIDELQTAADHACQNGDYKTTIALLKEALQQDHLTGEQRCELLKQRAAVYELVADTAAQIADLQAANQLLRQQLDEHDAELILLNTIAQALTEQHDIQAIYELVGDQIRDIFDAQIVLLGSFDPALGTLIPHYLFEKGERFYLEPGPLTVYDRILFAQRQVQVINENLTEWVIEMTGAPPEVPVGELPKSDMRIPLFVGDQVTGLISLQNIDREHAFSDDDARLLTTLANSMSVALENARLFDETQRLLKETEERNAELAVINSIQQGMAAELDFQGIVDLVGDELRHLFNEADVGIYWYDQQANLVEYIYLYEHGERVTIPSRPPEPDGVMETLIKTRRPLVLNDQAALEAFGMKALPGTPAGKALASVPIIGRDRVLGGIGLEDFERENAFGATELRLLTTVAHSMGTALENARLFDETQRLLKETEQRNAELAIINSVQEGLSMQLDFQGIVELIGEKVGGIFAADTTEVYMYDADRDWISSTYYVDRGQRIPFPDRPAQRPSLGLTVLDTRKPLILGTSEEAEKLGAIRVPRVGAEVDENESYLGVPILTGNKPIGLINVQSYKQNAFSQDDLRLLQTLANSMSVALENARLFDETQRLLKETEERNAELAVINSIQQGLVAQMGMQAIYDLVGDRVRDIFDAQGVMIATFDHEREWVTIPYMFEKGERFHIGAGLPMNPFARHLMATKKPVVVNEDTAAFQIKFGMGQPAGEPPLSMVFMPLLAQNRVNGFVSLQNIDHEHAFSQSDVRLLETLTASMSVALENARLFEAEQQRVAELQIINRVQEGLAAELDMQAIYDLVGDQIRDIFDAQSVLIVGHDKANDRAVFHYVYSYNKRVYPAPAAVTNTPMGQILLRDKKPVKLDTEADFRALNLQQIEGTHGYSKSGLFVPLLVGNEVRWGISLQNLEQEYAFSDANVRLLTTLANTMSVALENARLFDEVQAKNAEVLEALERETASNDILRVIAESPTDIRPVLDVIAQNAATLSGSKDAIIAIKDADILRVVSHYGDIPMIPIGEGIHFNRGSVAGQAMIEGRPIQGIHNQPGIKSEYPLGDEIAKKYGYRTSSAVPLMREGKAVGVINIRRTIPELLTDKQIALIQSFANQAAIAVENVRLFEAEKQRVAELQIINSVQEGLATELDMQAIYDLVGDQIRDIFAGQSVVIVGLDQANKRVEFHYVYENNERFYPTPVPIAEIPIGQLMLRDPKPIKLDTEAAFRALNLQTIEGTQQNSKSGLYVPLLVGGEVRWGISLQNLEQEYAFSDADVRLLTTLANSMSVALENARLFDETQHHAREMFALTEVGRDISATLDLPTVLERIASHARDLLAASDSAVFLLDESGERMRALVALGPIAAAVKAYAIQPGEGILGDVWQRGEAEVINAANKDPRARQIPGTADQPEERIMVVPLLVGHNVTGLMAVWCSGGDIFQETDLHFLEGLARQAAIAIENARLFDETQRLLEETQQRNAELAVINSVQQGLVAQLDIQAIYDLVGEQIRDIFDAQVVTINRFDQALRRNIYCCAFERGERLTIEPQPFTPIIEAFIKQGQPLLLNEGVEKFMLEGGAKIVAGEMPRSFLAVPLWSGNQVSGSISLQDVSHEHAFTEADLRLLTTLAASTSLALESARLYNEMEAARAAAVEANESKSAFLANVSHELRTPLTSILGFARIVQKRLDERIFPHVPEDDGRAQHALNQVSENLKIVLGEGERLTTLINNILDLEKIESGQVEWHMEPLPVADVVERGLQATTSIVEQAGLALEQEAPADLPFVNGDRDKLVQVVINLISNAVKFTPTGKITCRTALVDGEVQVSIQDTGVGIAAADLETVFEKFKQVGDTLTDKPQGTGLGLPICREILERHNGRIWAESVLEQGSTFTFALPVWGETA